MDFWDKVSDTISTKGKEVSEKAKELAETASLKRQIATCEEVIRKNYMEIGKLYFEEHGQEPEPAYEEFCRAVANAKAGVEDLEEQMKQVKGI